MASPPGHTISMGKGEIELVEIASSVRFEVGKERMAGEQTIYYFTYEKKQALNSK
jgi:hypothetical protein